MASGARPTEPAKWVFGVLYLALLKCRSRGRTIAYRAVLIEQPAVVRHLLVIAGRATTERPALTVTE
jgi:hypothetical protein